MSPSEIEFENRLDIFGADARACAAVAYTELTLRHELRYRDLARPMLAHRAFWRQMRAALRMSLFTTLARIYDESRNSNSAGQFLRFCERHLELFSPTSRIARQTAAGIPPELAAQHARAAFEPKPGAFAALFAELDRMRHFYDRTVQPAQARLSRVGYAADPIDTADPDELGGQDFGELAVFPLRVHRALASLYRDGTAPVLAEVPTALDAILSGQGAAWEHARAARAAAAFLRFPRFAAPVIPALDRIGGDAARYVEKPEPAFAEAGAGPG